jgi:ketosteroid isomerase-like protein
VAEKNENVNRFITALGRLEAERELEPLVGLFDAASTLQNTLMSAPEQGVEGARRFWSMYRASFEAIGSRFENVVVDGDRAALEWVATGTRPGGGAVKYRGVTLLEFSGDRVVRFRAYFDGASLGAQLTRSVKTAGR